MAITFAPFGSYSNVTGVVDATAKGEIQTLLNNFENLFTAPTANPDWDRIPKDMRDMMEAELNSLMTAINAAPTV